MKGKENRMRDEVRWEKREEKKRAGKKIKGINKRGV